MIKLFTKSISTITFSLLFLFTLSNNTTASTICAFNCPTDGGGEPSLPTISEIISSNGGLLKLDLSNGLIFMDSDIYNNLAGLTISASTPVYQGLAALPSSIILPDQFELGEIGFTSFFIAEGVGIDYVLLRHFQADMIMDLSTPDGIIVMDTSLLFASPVPVPAAVWLFGSGLIGLAGLARRIKA